MAAAQASRSRLILLPADIVAGLSVAALMLPESVAYAGIAGLSPSRALIAAVVGSLVYAFIGRSRFAIVSPTSSSA
ncbi:SulP family inorganic anion transporter, partial [Shewanella algae]